MKKLLALLMSLSMVLCFAACSEKEDNTSTDASADSTGTSENATDGSTEAAATNESTTEYVNEELDALQQEYIELMEEKIEIVEKHNAIPTDITDNADLARLSEIDLRIIELGDEIFDIYTTMEQENIKEANAKLQPIKDEYNDLIDELSAQEEASVEVTSEEATSAA